MVLIDTSVWIFALRKDFNAKIRERVDRLLAEDNVAVNGMIRLELLGGCRAQKEFDRLKNRLDALYCIEADEQVWAAAATMAYGLRRKGLTLPYTDIFVAATALREKAVVLHADEHYDLIAKHSGLNVESLLRYV